MDTLRQLVDSVTALHKLGDATLDNVLHAQNELLNAELEIVTTDAERTQIREEQVKNFREIENAMKRRHEVAQVTIREVLTARAARLEAEIKLLRE